MLSGVPGDMSGDVGGPAQHSRETAAESELQRCPAAILVPADTSWYDIAGRNVAGAGKHAWRAILFEEYELRDRGGGFDEARRAVIGSEL